MEKKKVKGKVLYIEDEVDACRTMIEFLNPRGFAAIISFSAEEAYSLLKKWNPDIILIDIKLIGQSGIAFIRKIQKEGIETPVIIITAYPKKVTQVELKGLKICGYYEKPYSYAELLSTITEMTEAQ